MIKSQACRRWTILLSAGILLSGPIAGLLTCPVIQRAAFPVAKFLTSIDLRMRDTLLATLPPLPPDEDLVFLGIDETSLVVGEDDPEIISRSRALTLMTDPFPWSREIWALAAERLLNAGARTVVIDLLLNSPREGDEALRTALEKNPGRIVLASNLAPPAMTQGASGGMGRYLPPASSLIPDAEAESHTLAGHVNFWPDLDGQVRRVSYLSTAEAAANLADHPASIIYPSLANATLQAISEEPPILQERGSFLFKPVAGLSAAYAPRPFYEIFWPSVWERNYANGEFFRGKVVMIGPSAAQFHDQHPTPAGTLLGPQIHLNAITAARHHDHALFRHGDNRTDAALTLGLGLLAATGVGFLRRPGFAIAGMLLLGLIFFFINRQILVAGTSTGLAGPALALILSGGFAILYDYSLIFRERLLLRRALERRVSAEVLQEILENPRSYLNQLGGVRKNVTVLFSDLRGFTKMSEHAEPEDLVAGLNTYFDLMVGRIQDDRGMVDKFIGDAIMAVWGSVPSLPPAECVDHAVRSALGMVRELEKLNARRAPEPPWGMGIGLHCGDAVTGNIGSEKRLELTVIGDAVNLASRLEGVTKRYGVPIVVSDAVAKHLSDIPGWHLRPIDRVRVVGRKTPVTLFHPLAAPGETENADQVAAIFCNEDWDMPFAAYQAGKFVEAEAAYAKLAEKYPDDLPANTLRDRCQEFQKTPPPSDWGGAIILDSK